MLSIYAIPAQDYTWLCLVFAVFIRIISIFGVFSIFRDGKIWWSLGVPKLRFIDPYTPQIAVRTVILQYCCRSAFEWNFMENTANLDIVGIVPRECQKISTNGEPKLCRLRAFLRNGYSYQLRAKVPGIASFQTEHIDRNSEPVKIRISATNNHTSCKQKSQEVCHCRVSRQARIASLYRSKLCSS